RLAGSPRRRGAETVRPDAGIAYPADNMRHESVDGPAGGGRVNLLPGRPLVNFGRRMRKLWLALLMLTLAGPLVAGSREEIFEKAYSMEGITKVSVENVNGSIEASAWDKPYFKVHAVKRADGSRA